MSPISKKNKKSRKMKIGSKAEQSAVVSGQIKKQVENRESKKVRKLKSERGVLFIKNIPHVFFEDQLKNFFNQFGKVTNLRLGRSRRTGGSKCYAFIEFQIPEVAQIAAETMNNYIMFQKLIKAAYIPPEQQKFNYFKTSIKTVRNSVGKIKFVSSKSKQVVRKMKQYNNWDDDTLTKRINKNMKKLMRMEKKYSGLGINFDDLTVRPSLYQQNSSLQANKDSGTSSNKGSSDDNLQTKNLKLIKRKASPEENVKLKSKKKNNSEKESPNLKDIFENTLLEEDSSDEDFVPIAGSEDDNDGGTDSDSGESIHNMKFKNMQEINEDSHSEEDPKVISKNFVRVSKNDDHDAFGKLIKRKSHSGGVHKVTKKRNKTKLADNKGKMKLAAAKEIVRNQKVQQLKKKVKV